MKCIKERKKFSGWCEKFCEFITAWVGDRVRCGVEVCERK